MLVSLPDGRRVEVIARDARRGPAVVYLHGAMGSPLRRCAELDMALDALGARLLMIQRPGFGRSDPLPGRSLLGHAADVGAVTRALGVERFFVLGVSAGGPYAAACAATLGERIAGAVIISGLSRLDAAGGTAGWSTANRAGLRVLRRYPDGARRALDAVVMRLRRRPRALTTLARLNVPDPGARSSAIASFLAASEHGTEPMIEDLRVLCRPWGFDPAAITAPVHIWHGMYDTLVPMEHALQLAIAIPGARVAFADEGHFFFRRWIADILTAMIGRLPDHDALSHASTAGDGAGSGRRRDAELAAAAPHAGRAGVRDQRLPRRRRG